jgi:L-fuconolactonase
VETARRRPDLRFVLDHVAKAPRVAVDHEQWSAGVERLADLPNVFCKLSGLLTEHDPAGTAERAIRWFGVDRCLFGSDWPVCLLAGGYAYGDALALAGDDENVLASTAIGVYGLRGSPTSVAGQGISGSEV